LFACVYKFLPFQRLRVSFKSSSARRSVANHILQSFSFVRFYSFFSSFHRIFRSLFVLLPVNSQLSTLGSYHNMVSFKLSAFATLASIIVFVTAASVPGPPSWDNDAASTQQLSARTYNCEHDHDNLPSLIGSLKIDISPLVNQLRKSFSHFAFSNLQYCTCYVSRISLSCRLHLGQHLAYRGQDERCLGTCYRQSPWV